MARSKTPLTDEQKQRIDILYEECHPITYIAKELGIGTTRVMEYIKDKPNRDGQMKKRGRKKLDDEHIYNIIRIMVESDSSMRMIMKYTGLSDTKIRSIMNELNIDFPRNIISNKEVVKEADYDLTLRSYEEDMELVDELKKELGELGKHLTFKVHEDITIGGTLNYIQSDKKVSKEYDTEVHKFDIFIPETGQIILPLKDNEDTTMDEEKQLWLCRLGCKSIEPDIYKSYTLFLICSVNRYNIIWEYMYDTNIIANRIRSHTPRKLYEEYPYIKVTIEADHKGDPELQHRMENWVKEFSKQIQEINMAEFKFWDKRGRIGKHNRGPLTVEEFQSITGCRNIDDAAADVSVRTKVLQDILKWPTPEELFAARVTRKQVATSGTVDLSETDMLSRPISIRWRFSES